MIPIQEAQAQLVSAVPLLPIVSVTIADALECVLADDIVARQSVPPFANCSLDGYAVRRADIAAASRESPVTLKVLGIVPAGFVAPTPVGPGEAWKVMTGAPLPEGADTVVMVELSSATREDPAATAGATVDLFEAPPTGTGVRAAGSDVRPGDIVMRAGSVLHPPRLAVLAGIGAGRVPVRRWPKVGVLVTGDELVREARPLEPGEIYEANGAMVIALLAQSNCLPIDLGIATDDPEQLRRRLAAAAATCDAIITTGGVSMGDADPVKLALEQLGRLQWLQVSMRPAKPFAYGLLDGPQRPVPVFGLPGNPVSSLVSFEVLVRPALRAMMGHTDLHRPTTRAIADESLSAIGTDGRTTMLRVRARFAEDGRLHVSAVGGAQESHQIAASADADALAVLAPSTTVEAGQDVTVRLLRWDS